MRKIKREKCICFASVILSLVGFATGWNYEKIISDSVIQCASGCFEWGLCALFYGYALTKCIKESIFSYLKELILFCGGFLFYPIAIVQLFSLCFKSGLTVRMLFFLAKLGGITGSFIASLTVLSLSVLSTVLFYFITLFFVSHRKRKQVDTGDLLLFKRIIFYSFLTLAGVVFSIILLSFTGLYGFFNTFI